MLVTAEIILKIIVVFRVCPIWATNIVKTNIIVLDIMRSDLFYHLLVNIFLMIHHVVIFRVIERRC